LLVDPSRNQSTQEKFTLRDCARNIRRFGAKHFSPSGKSPLTYFFVLLLFGEFEHAVAYLYSADVSGQHNHKVDAVHFGIARAHHHALSVPVTPQQSDGGLRLLTLTNDEEYEAARINFAHVLNEYARAFSATIPEDAIQYILLVAKLGDDATDSDAYMLQARRYIIDIVIENILMLEKLLGSVRADGTRLPGIVEKYGKLIGITNSDEFHTSITKEAAATCDYTGRYIDSIKLYDLAGEQDQSIFYILNKRLGEDLVKLQSVSSVHQHGVRGNTSPSKRSANSIIPNATQELIAIAQEILVKYTRHSSASSRGCATFIKLFEFMNLYGMGYFEQSITIMDSLDIFPRGDDGINRSASIVSGLDEFVVRALPVIIHAYMMGLGKLYAGIKAGGGGRMDGVRMGRLGEVKARARGLLMFTAGVSFKLGSGMGYVINFVDVYGGIVRVEADMC
jgi:nuclear pore complex protein Nup93